MARRGEDASVWIAYADFLTTLVVLFFLLFVFFAGQVAPERDGWVRGDVRDRTSDSAITGCTVTLGQTLPESTDINGAFTFVVKSLREPSKIGMLIGCGGYELHSHLPTVVPGETTTVPVRLQKAEQAVFETLPGDALFETNSYALKSGGDTTVRNLGLRWRSTLKTGEVVAVQGHSDDVEFPVNSGTDNWMLSSERAAAAVRVLTDPTNGVRIHPCQIVSMGFGPSRPVEAVATTDAPNEKKRKRDRNRRIEFRLLRGAEISRSPCGQR